MSLADVVPPFPEFVEQSLFGSRVSGTVSRAPRLFNGEDMSLFPHDRVFPVEVLVGCFWMIRREAMQAVGPLDEDFFMYSEDIDWCRRSWMAGRPVASSSRSARQFTIVVVARRPILSDLKSRNSGRCSIIGTNTTGAAALLAIECILFCRHVLRLLYDTLSRCVRLRRTTQSGGGPVISVACLRALLSAMRPRKADKSGNCVR